MNILILSTNDKHMLNLVRCLSVLGTKICIMSMNKFHPVRLSRYCSGYLRFSLQDLLEENDNIIDGINNYCDEQKLDIIIPAGIESTLFISKIRNRLIAKIFPLAEWETLKLLNNKWRFNEFMNKNGIPCPKTILVNDIKQIISLDIEFPIIVKQLELDDNKGVAKLNSSQELDAYITNGDEYHNFPLLIQEYIPGIDMGINILAKNGKIIACNMHKYYPNGHSRNVTQFIKDRSILDIGRKIIYCCNYTGVANIDLRLDDRDNSIKVIEFNPRFWGTLDISLLTGINFPYLGILSLRDDVCDKDMDYREIRYTVPVTLISNAIRERSLKDVRGHNLYFLQQIMSDPLCSVYICMTELISCLKKAKA